MTKIQLISRVLDITGKAGNEVYFDRLNERTEQYLGKLLKAVEKLSKK